MRPNERRIGVALLLCLALNACAEADLSQPLTLFQIREQLTGRTFTGVADHQRFLITFNRNGSATYYGADAQYLNWHVNEQGLCIRWFDQPAETCAEVYLDGFEGYRVGAVTLKLLEPPERLRPITR